MLREQVNSCLADQGVPRKGKASLFFLSRVETEGTGGWTESFTEQSC